MKDARYALFYDTETTGLPLWNEPSEDPRQPHLVQVAATLVDLPCRELQSAFEFIIRPAGWTIPDDVTAIHGISTEKASLVGIDEKWALNMLVQLWMNADVRIGHNEAFYARMIRIAMLRYGMPADAWKVGPALCTQALSTPILKLPPTDKMRAAGRLHHKSANLSEAYQYFTGLEHKGAHGAMPDVLACMAVYFGIQDHYSQGVSS